MHSCIIPLLDSGVKGTPREQEHSNEWDIRVLRVPVCAKGMNMSLLPYCAIALQFQKIPPYQNLSVSLGLLSH